MNTKNPDWKNKNLTVKEREVPADFSKGRKWEQVQFHRWKWWERVAFLFGHNMLVHIKFISQHSPGNCAVVVTPQITKFKAEDLKQNPSLQELVGDQPVETKKFGDIEVQKAQ